MKLSFLLLGLFFLSVAFRADARELTYSEKKYATNLKKSLKLKNFMESKIDVNQLSVKDFLSYKILKKKCNKANSAFQMISNSKNNYQDQSKKLKELEHSCISSLVNLSTLFLSQKS